MEIAKIDDLIDRYPVLLLDAYGVLVDSDGALPGAAALIGRLNALNKPYFLVSNTAAHSPQRAEAKFRGFGLDIAAERILTSGSLLAGYFQAHGLTGRRCAVLGPEDSLAYVRGAGGIPVAVDGEWEVVVVCDQDGFPFLDTLDDLLSGIVRRVDQANPPRLILPNPDLIYPRPGGFGFTSGALALLLEAALRQRYPERADLRFVRLGKPETALFAEAARRAGTHDLLMVGDQWETDIRGARAFGIDCALVTGGVASPDPAAWPEHLRPRYLLNSLEPGGR